MNNYGSPYGSTPLGGGRDFYDQYGSPSPTPSPRGNFFYGSQTPQRPSTRTHSRHVSSGGHPEFRPATAFSPRYRSDGVYGTVPDAKVSSSRKHSFSKGSNHHHKSSKRERRSSQTYIRTSYGDPDGDATIEVNGVRYPLNPESWGGHRCEDVFYTSAGGRHGTDYRYYPQGFQQQQQPQYFEKERTPDTPRREEQLPPRSATRAQHSRRSSQSMPQRPSTARPSSSHKRAPTATREATDADAKKHRIPDGYSLKNWDPTEEPIILLGSVFDSNSLGKWIYDWTCYRHGGGSPISDEAGELWLLLIQLSGKVRRSEEAVPTIRSKENRDMVEDFVESGERLTDKLRSLLKKCEAPMLKASKKKDSSLGSNSGVEFVDTLFGRDRELERTERFMQSVRLWNLRFDANCAAILKNPKM